MTSAPAAMDGGLLELGDPRWLALINKSPKATPFHHPAWSGVLWESYGFESFLIAAWHDSVEITAGLPIVRRSDPVRGRRWIGLPFTDFCPPIVIGGTAEMTRLVDLLRTLAEERGIDRTEVHAEIPAAGAHYSTRHVRHLLNLEAGRDATFDGMRSSVRRNIRRARKDGVKVRLANQKRDLIETFENLHIRTRRRQGMPVQPRRFFEALWNRVIDRGLGFVLIAELDERPVAAAVFLSWNKTAVYKYGASDRGALRHRPNDILLWAAIEHSTESGIEWFDFGRTDLANEGLRSFKRGFGAEELDLTYTAIAERAPGHYIENLADVTGPVVSRSPLPVVRLLGELLYPRIA